MRDDKGFIDVSASFGPEHGPARGEPLRALLEEQQAHGIGRSLAFAQAAVRLGGRVGNPIAIDVASDPANRVAAIAIVDASHSADPESDIRRWSSAGAVGFRFESAEAWPGVESEATSRALAAIARTGKPVSFPLLTFNPASAPASTIGRSTAGLGIPVILVGVHYSNVSDALVAAQRWEHLHVETSSLAHLDAVETAVARIGHERVLFGTGGPDRAHQAPINAVLLARIPDDTKRAILGGNAVRLFGLPAAPVDLTPPPLPERAFDVHTHLMPASTYDLPPVANAELLSMLSAWGTRAAVSSSFMGFVSDVDAGNEETVAAAARAPAHGGLLVLDPGDLGAARDHLRRWADAPGIRGVKIHSWYSRVPTADPRMAALFDLVAPYGLPVKIHNDGPGWEAGLQALVRAHPRQKVLLAHAGPGAPSPAAARVASEAEQVYVELASSFARLADMRSVVDIAGAERIAYGTDAPLLDPRWVLGSYADAGLAPDRTPGVYWDTAVRLFGIPG